MGKNRFSVRRCPATLLFILAVFLWCCPPAQAEGKILGKFKIAGQGELHLMVPEGWQANFRQPINDKPPHIIFTPKTGESFKMLITLLPNTTGALEFNSEERIRTLIRKESTEIAPSAKESNLTIQPITGRTGQGFYFLATDKNPKPWDYEYLMRAGLGVGNLLLSVSLVYREPNAPVVEETLNLLREASQP